MVISESVSLDLSSFDWLLLCVRVSVFGVSAKIWNFSIFMFFSLFGLRVLYFGLITSEKLTNFAVFAKDFYLGFLKCVRFTDDPSVTSYTLFVSEILTCEEGSSF